MPTESSRRAASGTVTQSRLPRGHGIAASSELRAAAFAQAFTCPPSRWPIAPLNDASEPGSLVPTASSYRSRPRTATGMPWNCCCCCCRRPALLGRFPTRHLSPNGRTGFHRPERRPERCQPSLAVQPHELNRATKPAPRSPSPPGPGDATASVNWPQRAHGN